MIILTTDQINSLILEYLIQEGYYHTHFSFTHESLTPSIKPLYSLQNLLKKGMQYSFIEEHLNSTTECLSLYSLTDKHICKYRSKELCVGNNSKVGGSKVGGSKVSGGSKVDASKVSVSGKVSSIDTKTIDAKTVDNNIIDTNTVDTKTVENNTVDTNTVDTTTIDIIDTNKLFSKEIKSIDNIDSNCKEISLSNNSSTDNKGIITLKIENVNNSGGVSKEYREEGVSTTEDNKTMDYKTNDNTLLPTTNDNTLLTTNNDNTLLPTTNDNTLLPTTNDNTLLTTTNDNTLLTTTNDNTLLTSHTYTPPLLPTSSLSSLNVYSSSISWNVLPLKNIKEGFICKWNNNNKLAIGSYNSVTTVNKNIKEEMGVSNSVYGLNGVSDNGMVEGVNNLYTVQHSFITANTTYTTHSEVTSLCWVDEDILCCGTYKGEIRIYGLQDDEQPLNNKRNENITEDRTERNINDNTNITNNNTTNIPNMLVEGGVNYKSYFYHKGPIFSIKEKEGIIITGCYDGRVGMIDLKGDNYRYFKVHNNSVFDLDFLDNERVVSCSSDYNIGLIDTKKGCWDILKGHEGEVNSICCKGGVILSSSDDKSVRLWDVDRDKSCIFKGHLKAVYNSKWVEEVIGSCSGDGSVRIWDVEKGCCKDIYSHNKGVLNMEWCDNKRVLVSGCVEGRVIFWDLRVGKIGEFKVGKSIQDMCFNGDGDFLCLCCSESEPVILNLRRL